MTTFTTDWFSYAIPNFTSAKKYLGQVNSVLEIGVYQGRSTCWTLQNMLSDNGSMTCVDPFIESDEIDMFFSPEPTPVGTEREKLFRANVNESKKPGQTVDIHMGRSFAVLPKLLTQNLQFDFIYCDGNHSASTVISDAVLCYGLLKKGGVLLFDDYLWDHEPDHHHRPKMSIDAFVNLYANHVTPFFINYQLAVVKIR
jgi:predicted O-methyltransferase YrrM